MKGILLALSLAIGLSSCTKELDERIVGTWNYTVDYRLDQGWYDEENRLIATDSNGLLLGR